MNVRHVPFRGGDGIHELRIGLVDFLPGENVRGITHERLAVAGVHVRPAGVCHPLRVERALRERRDLRVAARDIDADEEAELDPIGLGDTVAELVLGADVPVEPLVDSSERLEVRGTLAR